MKRPFAFLVAFVLALAPSLALADNVARQGGQQLHWLKDNQDGVYVYWVDHTPSGWPVQEAAGNWDASSAIDAIYRYEGTGCPSRCVGVRKYNFGTSCQNYPGETPIDAGPEGHLHDGTSARFNQDCQGHDKRLELVCHELGHTIGVGDKDSHGADTCMRPGYMTSPEKQYPDSHDFNMLDDEIYNHPN